jgi:AraC-like DNA-binding protein
MAFQPRIEKTIHGIEVLRRWHRQTWNGVVADVWDAACAPGAGGAYVADCPRLFIVLDRTVRAEARGPEFDLRLRPQRETPTGRGSPTPISYIPAGLELWAQTSTIETIRHLDLYFDAAGLSQRLGEDIDLDQAANPHLLVSDPRMMGLARLIAEECDNPDPLHQLYGDGLSLALLIGFLKLGRKPAQRRGKLSEKQLARVVGYIEENCLRPVRLQELAQLTDLSQSYFSHAFKASTGVAPHQWQVRARIERVKAMLAGGKLSLADIASIAGFSDQSHLTRVFRKHTGETPAIWQRSRRK